MRFQRKHKVGEVLTAVNNETEDGGGGTNIVYRRTNEEQKPSSIAIMGVCCTLRSPLS